VLPDFSAGYFFALALVVASKCYPIDLRAPSSLVPALAILAVALLYWQRCLVQLRALIPVGVLVGKGRALVMLGAACALMAAVWHLTRNIGFLGAWVLGILTAAGGAMVGTARRLAHSREPMPVRALDPSANSARARRARWTLAFFAAIGASCAQLVRAAFVDFLARDSWAKIQGASALILVLVLVFKFFDPLADRLREWLGVRIEEPRGNAGRLGFITTALIIGVAVAHGMIDEPLEENPWVLVWDFAGGMLVVGAITYAWLCGLIAPRRRARWYGLIAGLSWTLIWLPCRISWDDAPTMIEQYQRYLSLGLPGIATLVVFPVVGWVGGLLLDVNRRGYALLRVALPLVAAPLVLYAAFRHSLRVEKDYMEIPLHVAELCLGWLLALVAQSRSATLLQTGFIAAGDPVESSASHHSMSAPHPPETPPVEQAFAAMRSLGAVISWPRFTHGLFLALLAWVPALYALLLRIGADSDPSKDILVYEGMIVRCLVFAAVVFCIVQLARLRSAGLREGERWLLRPTDKLKAAVSIASLAGLFVGRYVGMFAALLGVVLLQLVAQRVANRMQERLCAGRNAEAALNAWRQFSKTQLGIVLFGAIGAAVALYVELDIERIAALDASAAISWIIATTAVICLSFLFFEPLMAQLRLFLRRERSEPSAELDPKAGLAVLIVVVVGILHGMLYELLAATLWPFVLFAVVEFLTMAWQVYAWLSGTLVSPRRAARSGLWVGAITLVVSSTSLLGMLIPIIPAGDRDLSGINWVGLARGLFLSLKGLIAMTLLMLVVGFTPLLGFAVGRVIDRNRSVHAGRLVLVVFVLASLTLFTLGMVSNGYLGRAGESPDSTYHWLSVLALGWGLGMFAHPALDAWVSGSSRPDRG
jgi:hypothetical protein